MGRPPNSRAEALDHPAAAFAAVVKPVMEPVRAVLPELVRLGDEAKAAPARRPRKLAATGLELGGGRFEGSATLDNAALRRHARADLRAARARGEVGVGLGLRDALDRPFDPHLPPERVPVEEERRARVRGQLGALAALVAGEEDEAALVEALTQHHADGR